MTRTNLITGFLGSGKTTSILHLLAQKPADEKWAVLVNEFGEVGIDGALLADSGALLKEIPGGCMCCVNGLPMQVGLNTLLRQGKPDRLLIEPTGLGHPKQILDILTAAVYEPWIDLRATLCILDPRQLLDERAVSNDNFRDQLAAADIIVAMSHDGTPPRCRRARSTPTAIPPLPASPRSAWRNTSAGADISTMARAIRAAAGSSTRRRFLTPSACSNGPGWRQWGALKA